MYRFCEQCGKFYYAKRSDSKLCSAKCRKRKQRGTEPDRSYYHDNEDIQYEQMLTTIAASDDLAFRSLVSLRETYGYTALKMALNAIIAMNG